MAEQAKYERARKKVEELKGFYVHLLVYVLVNAFLFLVNLLSSDGEWWFYWPLFGWGVGIVVHAVSVFGGLWGQEWESRKIRELMEKDHGDEDSRPRMQG